MNQLPYHISQWICKALLIAFFIVPHLSSQACDRTEISLDSLHYDNATGQYTVYATLCIGAGITGIARGADNSTSTFAFAIWGAPGLSLLSFTPTLTSDFTGVTNTGTPINPASPLGTALGVQAMLGYISPGFPYTCVSSIANCGNVHTDCKSIELEFNDLPDSIRVYGPEGSGNPVAGCFPDADMLLDFTSLPVTWTSFHAQASQENVQLNWSTADEVNNDYFQVMRSGDGTMWDEIGRKNAVGNSSSRTDYAFTDEHPLEGPNHYRITQVDHGGSFTMSEVVTLNFSYSNVLEWREVGPVTDEGLLHASFTSTKSEALALQVVDLQGKVLQEQSIDALTGLNRFDLELSPLSRGIYILHLRGSQGTLRRKVVKM